MKKKDSVVLNVAEEDKKEAGAFRKQKYAKRPRVCIAIAHLQYSSSSSAAVFYLKQTLCFFPLFFFLLYHFPAICKTLHENAEQARKKIKGETKKWNKRKVFRGLTFGTMVILFGPSLVGLEPPPPLLRRTRIINLLLFRFVLPLIMPSSFVYAIKPRLIKKG